MKVILTEKITKLGNIGDTVNVATGFARNYLIPNNKAMRFSKETAIIFEAKKAELVARHEKAKKAAEANLPKITAAKLHLIRSAGDTGHLYGSVSSRDIAHLVKELTGIEVLSEQVLLNHPIKEIGAWEMKIALHPDVIAIVKAYVAQTKDEIDMLVAGKSLKKDNKVISEPEKTENEKTEKTAKEKMDAEKPIEEKSEPEKKPRKPRAKKTEEKEEKSKE